MMQQARNILQLIAKALSYVLYPLWIPTYGMLLFCANMSTVADAALPVSAWVVCVGTTFVLTALIPITAIMIRIRRGLITDIHIDDSDQRTVPYLYAAMGFGFWCYFVIAVLRAPIYLDLIAIGATVALICVMLINRCWKISAHLTGMGGLVGGVMSYYLTGHALGLWFPLMLMLLSLLLMYSRIYLRAHEPLQVIAGFLLGLCLTFIPNMLVAYVV